MSRLAPPTVKDPNDGSLLSGGKIGGSNGAGFGAFAAGGEKGRWGAMTGAGFGACGLAGGTAGAGENGTDKGDALCAAAAARGFRLAAIWAMLQRSRGSRSSACCAICRNGWGRDSGTEGREGDPPGTRCISTSITMTPSDHTS